MILYLYSLCLYLLLPFILMRLWWRGRKVPAYRQRILERFGFFKAPQLSHVIWIHAVSLGEAVAADGLIRELLNNFSKYHLVITTMTPTGSERILNMRYERVFHVYVPYDFPKAVKRFLNKINPKLAIMMEMELWPNIFYQCGRRRIPLFLANARLSERSAKGYHRIALITKIMLQQISMLAAQTEQDAKRFMDLGLPTNKIMVTGSIKFDSDVPQYLIEKGRKLRADWHLLRPIWIAASTHQNEEEQVLEAFATVRQAFPDLLLILVPRHPDRFFEVTALCKQRGYQIVCRSQHLPCTEETNIFVGDSMGELFMYYAMADIAYLGGSLVPIGGHNLLEPAALGLPVITGNYLFNSIHISELLKNAGGAFVVNNPTELAEKVIYLLRNKNAREQSGQAGLKVVMQNRGALQKHLNWITKTLQILHQSDYDPTMVKFVSHDNVE